MATFDLLLHQNPVTSWSLPLSTTQTRTRAHHLSLSCPLPDFFLASVRKPAWPALAPHGFINWPRYCRPPGCIVSKSLQIMEPPFTSRGAPSYSPPLGPFWSIWQCQPFSLTPRRDRIKISSESLQIARRGDHQEGKLSPHSHSWHYLRSLLLHNVILQMYQNQSTWPGPAWMYHLLDMHTKGPCPHRPFSALPHSFCHHYFLGQKEWKESGSENTRMVAGA